MNLHAITPPRQPTPSIPTCPVCGESDFYRYVTSKTYERHFIWFTSPTQTPGQDWKTDDHEITGGDPWLCNGCDLEMPDDIQELIDDLR